MVAHQQPVIKTRAGASAQPWGLWEKRDATAAAPSPAAPSIGNRFVQSGAHQPRSHARLRRPPLPERATLPTAGSSTIPRSSSCSGPWTQARFPSAMEDKPAETAPQSCDSYGKNTSDCEVNTALEQRALCRQRRIKASTNTPPQTHKNPGKLWFTWRHFTTLLGFKRPMKNLHVHR